MAKTERVKLTGVLREIKNVERALQEQRRVTESVAERLKLHRALLKMRVLTLATKKCCTGGEFIPRVGSQSITTRSPRAGSGAKRAR